MRRTQRVDTYDLAGNLIETRTDVWDSPIEQDSEETLRTRADEALASLVTVANGTGTMTTAQLTSTVRLLARGVAALIRLQLRRLDSID